MRRYKADLSDEIEPQINELLSRAEKGLQVLLKRESILQAKVRSYLSEFLVMWLIERDYRPRRRNHALPRGQQPTQLE